MATLAITLFFAGMVTILLPCILPLIPIVLGVSIAGRSKIRPLLVVLGMLLSFVGFTFLLQVALSQFVELADYLRIGTYFVLLLFGLGFLTHNRPVHGIGAILGSLFFLTKGWPSVIIAAILGIVALELGGRVATKIQQFGTDIQGKASTEFGQDSPFTAFIIGLTLGLVWVPCAGPALGFALTLVREQPGPQALLLLTAYAAGTAVPLLLIGYGGQYAVQSVRAVSRYTGIIKQVAGAVLIVTAIALHFNLFLILQTQTSFGGLGTTLENLLVNDRLTPTPMPSSASTEGLPRITRAPELNSAGPWHNSQPLKLSDLKGKVVLIDFWTYSCINCIRTLPYIQGYWDKYGSTELTTGKDAPFVIIGVHAPEFVFEKSEDNVAAAIKRYGLTYPTVQDNDFGTWKAFANRYWPAKYLIDAEGYIRYTHFGEGEYDETDAAIASLLKEIDVDTSAMPMAEDPAVARMPLTGETYLGERSWPALGNQQGDPSDKVVTYKQEGEPELHRYYLNGDWQLLDGERQTLRSKEGAIRIRALAGEVNLVLGLEDGAKPVQAEVWADGQKTKTFTVDRDDLYPLFKGAYGEHDVLLKLKGAGVEGYAYTFGA